MHASRRGWPCPRGWSSGPGDDAAVIEPERGALDVLTTDALVEGVHFDLRFVPPDAVGHRALAVNLSDLAAMGAEAACRAAVAGAARLARRGNPGWHGRRVDRRWRHAHRVALVGGNITRTPGPLVVDVTATGTVRPRRMLTRAGARPGDEVYVTGTLGDAPSAALAAAECGDRASQGVGAAVREQRYLRPEPRVRAGMLLGRNRAASSCMDLSDGLADGVRQVAAASSVGITIDAAALPLADDVRRWHEITDADPVETALQGGDDYELLFTARPAHRAGCAT